MHSCWNVPEVVVRVFKFLDRKTAAKMARVQRLFLEPALDVIWRNIDLHQLLHYFPADVFVGGSDIWLEAQEKRVLPARGITLSDWGRAAKFARRVRSLQIYNEINPCLEMPVFSDRFYTLLAVSIPQRGPFFPNLIELRVALECEAMLPFLALLLHPNLRILSLFIPIGLDVRGSIILPTLLSVLPISSPRLTKFYIACDWHPNMTQHVVQSISHAVHELRYLQDLMLPYFDPIWVPAALMSPHGAGVLPYLARASFKIKDLTCLHEFIKLAGAAQLSVLHAFDIAQATSDQWRRFFKHLSSATPQLTSLSLDEAGDLQDEDSHFIFPDILRPMLHCSGLRKLELRYSAFALSEEFIAELAQRLPNLINLQLGQDHRHGYSRLLPMRSLIHLAQHCRSLETIGMAFDATLDMAPGTSSLVTPSFSRLTGPITLRVGKSPINNPQHVAIFLSALFEKVIISDNLQERPELWPQVVSLVDMLNLARQQERNHVLASVGEGSNDS